MHSTPDYLFDLPADRHRAKWRAIRYRAAGIVLLLALIGLAVTGAVKFTDSLSHF